MKQIFRSWIVIIALFVSGCSGGSNWPTFQHDPSRTGACAAPPVEKPIVLWQTYIGIQGYLNNPVLAGGRIFVGSSGRKHNKPDRRDGIYCLDSITGMVIWHRRTETDACGVAYAGGRIFSTGDDGYLRALAATGGRELWKIKRPGELYCQPLVAGKLVIVGDSTGTVIAADQKSGRIVWSAKVAESNVRGGLSSDGRRIYAAFLAGKVACLDFEGKVLWSRNILNGAGDNIYPAPTIAGDLLIVGYARNTYYPNPAFKALSRADGRIVWEASDKGKKRRSYGNIRSSVCTWGNLLLYGEPYSNDLVALSRADGSCQWRLAMGKPMFPHWPSPAVASGVLYLPRHDGGLYAIDLQTRKLKWMLYLGKVTCVGDRLPEDIMPAESVNCAWNPAVGKPLYASPAIDSDGTIYIGSGQGFFYAIGEGFIKNSLPKHVPVKKG